MAAGSGRRSVFQGREHYAVCRDVSDQDCDRPVAASAPNCGIEEHVRLRANQASERDGSFIRPAQERRPKLIVDEEYDLLDEVEGEAQDLDPDAFDPAAVRISIAVQKGFTAHHKVSAAEAIEEVRLLLRLAVEAGNYIRTRSGFYACNWRGYQVVLSPDLRVAVSYKTRHYERTPSMVLEGTPSRLKGAASRTGPRRRDRAQVEIPADLEVGQVVEGTVESTVNFGVFVDLGTFSALIHKTELEDGPVEVAKGYLPIGAEVRARIISIDRSAGRVGLSLRQVDEGAPRGGS